jgi:hypothetical protein
MCFLPTLRIPRRRWTEDGFKRYQIPIGDTMTERGVTQLNATPDGPSIAPQHRAR